MSGYVDTREGWRELDVVTPDSIYQLAEYDPADGSVVRAWVREEPVPPLPTEPYSIVRVTWANKNAPEEFVRRHDGDWQDAWGSGRKYGNELRELILGFEVLAEPRAVTAKAVLAEVEDFLDMAWQPGQMRVLSYDTQKALFTRVRDRFGASS